MSGETQLTTFCSAVGLEMVLTKGCTAPLAIDLNSSASPSSRGSLYGTFFFEKFNFGGDTVVPYEKHLSLLEQTGH
jgi:hypothetical protein